MPNMSCRIRHVEHIEYTSNNIVLDYFQGLICCIEQRKDFVRVFNGDSNLFNLSRPDTGRKERIYIFIFTLLCMKDLKAPQKSVKIRI